MIFFVVKIIKIVQTEKVYTNTRELFRNTDLPILIRNVFVAIETLLS